MEAEEGEVTAEGRLTLFGASAVMIEEVPSPVNSSSDKSMNEVGEVNPATQRPSSASLLQSLYGVPCCELISIAAEASPASFSSSLSTTEPSSWKDAASGVRGLECLRALRVRCFVPSGGGQTARGHASAGPGEFTDMETAAL